MPRLAKLPRGEGARIARAVAAGRISPRSVAKWTARALAGEDISVLDELRAPPAAPQMPVTGPTDEEFAEQAEISSSEFEQMFAPTDLDEARSEQEARQKQYERHAAAVSAMSDDQIYDEMHFPPGRE